MLGRPFGSLPSQLSPRSGCGTTGELGSVGVGIVLYPLSAFRAANAAALKVYKALRGEGTQKNVIDIMQSRMELYDYLGYHEFEQKLDRLFSAGPEQ